MAVKPIPAGYHSVTPYIIADGASDLLDFMKKAFEAQVAISMKMPDGKIGHAEVTICDSKLMVSDATDRWKAGTTSIYLYVPDCDTVYNQALAAGGESVMEPADQFYGDRHGGVKDPTGNTWWIATHIEDVAIEDLAKRKEKWMEKLQK